MLIILFIDVWRFLVVLGHVPISRTNKSCDAYRVLFDTFFNIVIGLLLPIQIERG